MHFGKGLSRPGPIVDPDGAISALHGKTTLSIGDNLPRAGNMAPAIGVPKMEEKPALIPHITIFFLSTSSNLRREANNEANVAPIWAAGPSLPAEPPAEMVTTVARSFTGATFGFILPLCLFTASMTFSVPWPSASGERYFTSRVLASRAKGRAH